MSLLAEQAGGQSRMGDGLIMTSSVYVGPPPCVPVFLGSSPTSRCSGLPFDDAAFVYHPETVVNLNGALFRIQHSGNSI